MPKWIEGNIISIQEQSNTTKLFTIKAYSDAPLQWSPGQFVVMDLPIHKRRTKRWRTYSIANIPNNQNLLEFSITYKPDGLGTTYLFQQATIGTKIKFKPPTGVFTLKNPNKFDQIILIATGTGVAPFRAMTLAWENENNTFPNTHLIFGTRDESGILFRSEFEKLEEKHPQFTYSVSLSRQPNSPFFSGHVHQVYLSHYQNPSKNSLFMLCGWQKMVDQAHENIIQKLRVSKSRIITELYG